MFTLQEILRFGQINSKLDLDQYRDIGFTSQLIEAFEAMKSYIFLLEGLEKGKPSSEDTRLQEIADRRNSIQHTMLCLPSGTEIHDSFSEEVSLYDACRISGLIFSMGVIFPLPYEAAPLSRLAIMLKLELQQVSVACHLSLHARGILLWILVIGGIAAVDTREVGWFVSRLHQMADENGVREWGQLKRLLKRILWLDSACDMAGQQLWYEVERSRSYHG